MGTKSHEFKAGDPVPTSGVYEAIHDKLDGDEHAHPHPVIAISGAKFPTCRACRGHVRFRLAHAAEPVDDHHHFQP